jgi:flavodoxin I
MNTLVVYDSQYGNTERVAQSIAEALRAFGQVRTVRAGVAPLVELGEVDALILGCPTQGWRPTKATHDYLANTPAASLRRLAVACFDTRFHKPRWLTGSAAAVLVKKLQQVGVKTIMPPESFFVLHTEGPLEPGELERATAWANTIANKIAPPHPVMP